MLRHLFKRSAMATLTVPHGSTTNTLPGCKVMLQGCPEAFFHGLQAFQQVDWAGKPALPRFWVRLNWLNSAEFEDFRSHSGQIRGRPKNHEISRLFTVFSRFSRFLGFCRNYPNCTSGHFSRPIQRTPASDWPFFASQCPPRLQGAEVGWGVEF